MTRATFNSRFFRILFAIGASLALFCAPARAQDEDMGDEEVPVSELPSVNAPDTAAGRRAWRAW